MAYSINPNLPNARATADMLGSVKLVAERCSLQIPPVEYRPKPDPNQGVLFEPRSLR